MESHYPVEILKNLKRDHNTVKKNVKREFNYKFIRLTKRDSSNIRREVIRTPNTLIIFIFEVTVEPPKVSRETRCKTVC